MILNSDDVFNNILSLNKCPDTVGRVTGRASSLLKISHQQGLSLEDLWETQPNLE